MEHGASNKRDYFIFIVREGRYNIYILMMFAHDPCLISAQLIGIILLGLKKLLSRLYLLDACAIMCEDKPI